MSAAFFCSAVFSVTPFATRLNIRAPMDKAFFLGLASVIHGRIRQIAMAFVLSCAAVTIDLIAGIGPTKSGDGGAIVVVTAAGMVAVVCITVGIGPTKSGSACGITADSGSSAGESTSGSRPIKSGSDSTTKAGVGDPGVGACVAGTVSSLLASDQ